ncbi:MAG: hypothetical protein IKE77_09955 [Erysipelotrichaceae bacterium]|nr:hypothetical protein [Erysipelotrichaceae bacterium]
MKKGSTFLKRGIIIIMMFGMMFTGVFSAFAGSVVHAEEDEDNTGKAIYEQIAAMGDRSPRDWGSEKDPFGYGKDVPFYLNQQQELLVLKSKGVSGGNDVISYDTFKSGNVEYPFKNAKSAWDDNINGKYTLSFIRSVAFDPSGSGRKDHVAYIGVYSKENNDPDKNPPLIQIWVMDKNGNTSDRIDITDAVWMCDSYTYNNRNMWDFNAMNFIDITAGDYDKDGRDSLVVWACGTKPTLREVACTVKSGKISLSIREGDGYPDDDGSLFLKPYSHKTGDEMVYNRIHGAIETGDLNGDGIDDLVVLSYVNRVSDNLKNKVTEYYLPNLAVSYGVAGSSTAIVKGDNAVRHVYACWSDGWEWREAPAAAGLAVGDINGDGTDEAIVAGFFHEIKGILGQEVKNPYNILDPEKLVVSIHGKDLRQLLVQRDLPTNEWTRGAAGYGGLFLKDSTEGDHSWQQTGVETVAINGKGRPEHIFINGTLYMVNGSKLSAVYTGDYFKAADKGMDLMETEETYIRSMAVGNFDGNEEGYEQIAYVVGGADRHNVGNVKYTQGMMGGIYKKDGAVSQTAVDYYSTELKSMEKNYYPDSSSSCELSDVLSYELTAWDTDSDGLRVKYIGKSFNYTDPTVMAVLQAPPYFEELKGAMTGYETAYTITTSYSYATGEGKSTSFSIGAELEVEAEVVKLNAELSYATNWEKTFTDELTTSDEYTFKAIGEDQVVLYRTPVTSYTYQVEVNGNFSDANTTTLSFPGIPSKALMSVKDYNAFVEYYNAENQRRAEREGLSGEIPKMKKITDQYLDNEGDPFGYMQDTDDHSNVTILQTTPNSFEVGSSSTGYAWSQEHSASEEETMEHGFNFGFSMMFQLRAPVGHTGVGLAVKTSLEYMESTSVSETNAKGKGISCEVGNMDPESLEEMNVSKVTANQYGFSYQLVTWPSGIKSIENLEDWEHDEDEPSTKTVDVPIYGYLLSGTKAGAPMVNDLYGEFVKDDSNAINIKLSWSNPSTENREVGEYTLYLDERDGSLKEIAMLAPYTTEYIFRDLDGRDAYSFMIRARKDVNDSIGGVDSNRAYLYLGAPAIHSIELVSSDETKDTYKLIHTDGTVTEFVVRHGVGIIGIEKISSSEDGLTDTYKITFTDGTSMEFTITNGKDGKEIELRTYTDETSDKKIIQWHYVGEKEWRDLVEVSDAAFIEGRKVELRISEGYIQWQYEGDETWTNLLALSELKGDKGEQGNGIVSIEKTATSEDGLIDTYTITYSDGTTEVFTVTNGRDGKDGLSAYELAIKNKLFEGSEAEWVASLVGNGIGIEKIEKTGSSEDGLTDNYVIVFTDGSTYPFTVTNGARGEQGNGIVSIEKTATSEDGLIDTYTITYSDGTATTFNVANGKDGKDGADGKSAYDLAVENGFKGTVAEWIASLNGISVVGTKINENGNLIVTMSDGSTVDAGKVNGNDGISIRETKLNEKGELIITLSNGDSFNLGVIVGATGRNGTNGQNGANGHDGKDGADGKDGKDGNDGADGKDGAGISGIRIDENGNLIVNLTDGTVINAGRVTNSDTASANSVPWWMLAWNGALTAGLGGVGYGYISQKKSARKKEN